MKSKNSTPHGQTVPGRFDLSKLKSTPEDSDIYRAGFVLGETVHSARRRLMAEMEKQQSQAGTEPPTPGIGVELLMPGGPGKV